MNKTIAASVLILALASSPTYAGGLIIGGNGGSSPNLDPFRTDFHDKDGDYSAGWPTFPKDIVTGADIPSSGSLIGKAPKIDLNAPAAPNKKFDIPFVPGAPGTIASAGGNKIDGVSLACSVAGTPTEFPDDILIANTGLVEIPARTRVVWQTQAPRLQGTAVLAKPLKPGKTTYAKDVLRGGLPAGTPCEVLTPHN